MEFKTTHKHAYILLGIEVVFIILFAFFAKYAPNADAKCHPFGSLDRKACQDHDGNDPSTDGGQHPTYGMFQDVHVMIFIGFGFLMTFLKKYGFGSVGFNFMISAIAVQWAILVNGFFHLEHGYILVSLDSLLSADFVAACVLISFGVVLGKTTPTQLIILTIIEVPIFVANEVIGRKLLGAIDIGDSMFVHAFGAYFGLAVSRMIARDEDSTEKEGSTKTSDIFAILGAIFLWMYWPSFNGGAASGDDQHRAIVNTYLALTASCIAAYALSSLVDPDRKFDMVHIQNSSLAGGVAVGTSADLMTTPFGAIIIGVLAGGISVAGYHYLTPLLASRMRIHDTCGVHNLHGMPAVLAGIVGAIYAAMADEATYGTSLYAIFPSRAPVNGTDAFTTLQKVSPGVEPGEGRSGAIQAAYQLAALVISITIAAIGGVITGAILNLKALNHLNTEELYEDEGYWKIEHSEVELVREISPSLVIHKEKDSP